MSLELLEKPSHPLAWDRFLELGLPGKKSEAYRYVRFKDLYSRPFCSLPLFKGHFEPRESTLVLTNGTYCESLSRPPPGLIALPFSKAFATYGSFLQARLNKWVQEEQDPFAILNGAYYPEGLFLYLPPHRVFEAPITILHLVDAGEKAVHICPRIHLFAGKHAMAHLALEQSGCPDAGWINAFMDCTLEDSAAVTLTKVNHLHGLEHHFWTLRATLKQSSTLKTFSVTNGAATSREDYGVRLQGEGAEADLYGVWSLQGNRQHHVYVTVDHQEPSTTSLQKFKGTLADSSRSSFEGRIYVRQKAQKTQAFQANNNLLLGEKAVAYSKPRLEIFADDVKASHGATIGQIDAELLFYLTARGIPAPVAKQLLVQGFSKEVIELMTHPKLKEEALRMIS